MASGSPIAGNDVIQPSDDLPGTSGWKSVSLSLEERSSPADGAVIPRDEASLEKRVFTSPHMKRAFKLVIANTISAATWVIDFSMNEVASSQVTLNYKLQSSQGITQADVEVPSITRIYESENQFRCNAKMELLGKYAGKVVHIWFNGEVFGSGAEMVWQRMISEPVCYVNGVKTAIQSWTFWQNFSIAHFAWHGMSHPTDLDASHTLLQKKGSKRRPKLDRLTVGGNHQHHLPQRIRFLVSVFVCMCDSSSQKPGVRDENVHLASTLQIAGFFHAVGSLWSANDDACAEVARFFDEELSKYGEDRKLAVAGALRRAIMKVRTRGQERHSGDVLYDARLVELGDDIEDRLLTAKHEHGATGK
ncbi:hypothetical protein FCIRC_11426 [Fusarium circinatum]|uniref:CHAT domain-containing protein n=1 Tax=Fusarium circinatum TaxID=48490 RepID=A0A8H5T3T3_FUSCI|nr:hypothetical protein FCIRC_11426 [Fusarium circinatum]